MSSVLPSCLV